MKTIRIETETIKLEQLLKLCGEAGTGGSAKLMIGEGLVTINGELETRRGKKLKEKDVVDIQGRKYVIEKEK